MLIPLMKSENHTKYINENEDLNFIEGTGVHYSVFKEAEKATRLQLDQLKTSQLLIASDHHSGWQIPKLSEASILEGFHLQRAMKL